MKKLIPNRLGGFNIGKGFITTLCLAGICIGNANRSCPAEPTPRVKWVRGIGGENFANAGGVAVDGEGHAYIVGSFDDSQLTIDGVTLTNRGERQGLILKLNRAGHLLWAQETGVSAGANIVDVALDAATNVFLAGSFSSTNGILGATNVATSKVGGVYVAKLNRNGELAWVTQGGGSNPNDFGTALALDGAANCYVLGALQSTGDFMEEGVGLAVDKRGNCYVTGGFNSASMAMGGGLLMNASTEETRMFRRDAFAGKFDGHGNALWLKRAGGAGEELGRKLSVDQVDNVLWIGFYSSEDTSFDTWLWAKFRENSRLNTWRIGGVV